MDEMDMRFVEIVLDTLEIIARHRMAIGDQHALDIVELGETRKLRRFTLAEIGEDQADIFLCRIGARFHLGGEVGFFGRLLDALAMPVEFPAVIEAADAVARDRAQRERGLAMRAAIFQHIRRAALAAIKREILVQDLDALRVADLQVSADIDRLPEMTDEAAGKRARHRMREITVFAWLHRVPSVTAGL